jgi:hypothetical protein
MFEVQGVMSCDRCHREVAVGHTDEERLHGRLVGEGWAEDEDGMFVCAECWAKAVSPPPSPEKP